MAAKLYGDTIDPVRYTIISERAKVFSKLVADPNADPVKVFDPLNQKQMDELILIREVSKELQAKKDEDIRKQQAAAQAEADRKAAEAEKEKEEKLTQEEEKEAKEEKEEK